MSKVRMVDPPSGWAYGFPDVCDDDTWYNPDKFVNYLREHGYPEDDIDFAASYIRVWFEEDNNDTGQ